MSQSYQWPEQKRCAFVFSVDVDIESPMAWRMRGQTVRGMAELEQRRFGERQGLDRLNVLLEAFKLKASFYVPALEAKTYPHILEKLTAAGHEVGLHGYHHELVHQLSPEENTQVLDRSLAVFKDQGVTPLGYRSPAWELTPELPDLLKERGLLYDSSLMGFEHPYSVEGLVEVPVQWLTDDAIYFKFSGGGLDRWHPASPDAVLASWLSAWEAAYRFGGLLMLTVHPWISGQGQRILMLEKLLQEIHAYENVWFATAAEVATYHSASVNMPRFAVSHQPLDTNF